MDPVRVSRKSKSASSANSAARTAPASSTSVPPRTALQCDSASPVTPPSMPRSYGERCDARQQRCHPHTHSRRRVRRATVADELFEALESGFGTTWEPFGSTRERGGPGGEIGLCKSIHARRGYRVRPGEYQPSTPQGQELIAHEVAHTLQPPDAGVVHREPADSEEWTPLAPTQKKDPLRLSYSDFLRLEDTRRQPLRRWLDINTSRLRLLSKCALTARVRSAVPESSSFADIEIHSVLNEWAAAHAFSIPRSPLFHKAVKRRSGPCWSFHRRYACRFGPGEYCSQCHFACDRWNRCRKGCAWPLQYIRERISNRAVEGRFQNRGDRRIYRGVRIRGRCGGLPLPRESR